MAMSYPHAQASSWSRDVHSDGYNSFYTLISGNEFVDM
jgi:hypothetical protein